MVHKFHITKSTSLTTDIVLFWCCTYFHLWWLRCAYCKLFQVVCSEFFWLPDESLLTQQHLDFPFGVYLDNLRNDTYLLNIWEKFEIHKQRHINCYVLIIVSPLIWNNAFHLLVGWTIPQCCLKCDLVCQCMADLIQFSTFRIHFAHFWSRFSHMVIQIKS